MTETGNAETVSASDVEEAVAFFVEDTFGRMLLDGATPDQRAAALASLHEALEQKVTANGVELGGAAWIATATSTSTSTRMDWRSRSCDPVARRGRHRARSDGSDWSDA